MRRVITVSCVALLLMGALAPRAATQRPDREETELDDLLKALPAKADPKDDALRKLLKERYNAAVEEVDIRLQRARAGADTPDLVLKAAQRFVEAGLELNDKPAEQVALLEKHVALAKHVEKLTRERIDAGIRNFTPADLAEAKYARADAEIRLLRAKEKAKGEKK